jgi:hypothetical protein
MANDKPDTKPSAPPPPPSKSEWDKWGETVSDAYDNITRPLYPDDKK